MKKKIDIWFLARAGIIGALYAAITLLVAPISFGMVQFRLSEALCVLPYYDKSAIPGLFVGCLVANIVGGNGIWDVVIGSLATLLAAYLTSLMAKSESKNKFLFVPMPPVLINGLLVGFMLHWVLGTGLLLTILSVSFGEAVVCYILGSGLMLLIEKNGLFAKKNY